MKAARLEGPLFWEHAVSLGFHDDLVLFSGWWIQCCFSHLRHRSLAFLIAHESVEQVIEPSLLCLLHREPLCRMGFHALLAERTGTFRFWFWCLLFLFPERLLFLFLWNHSHLLDSLPRRMPFDLRSRLSINRYRHTFDLRRTFGLLLAVFGTTIGSEITSSGFFDNSSVFFGASSGVFGPSSEYSEVPASSVIPFTLALKN